MDRQPTGFGREDATFNILCYGDSLTWGFDAVGPERHRLSVRWPNVLQVELGEIAAVVADGLCGRTTAYDDHSASEERNGARTLPTALAAHSPLDLVVIMLGSNDTKPWIHGRALGAKKGMARLAQIVRHHPYQFGASTPKLIIVSPPPVNWIDDQGSDVFERSNEDSLSLAAHYRSLSEELNCGYFNAASVAKTTTLDGVHLDAENTRAVGTGLAPIVRTVLGIPPKGIEHPF